MTTDTTLREAGLADGAGLAPERDTAASEMARLLELSALQAADVRILELALKAAGDAMNDLLAACHGPDGKLKAPDKKEVMRARSMLPPRYSYSLSKKT